MEQLRIWLAARLLHTVNDNTAAPGQDIDDLEYYLSLLSSSSTEKRSKHVIRRLLGTYMVLKKTHGATLLEPVLHYTEYASEKLGKRSSVGSVTALTLRHRRQRPCTMFRCFSESIELFSTVELYFEHSSAWRQDLVSQHKTSPSNLAETLASSALSFDPVWVGPAFSSRQRLFTRFLLRQSRRYNPVRDAVAYTLDMPTSWGLSSEVLEVLTATETISSCELSLQLPSRGKAPPHLHRQVVHSYGSVAIRTAPTE